MIATTTHAALTTGDNAAIYDVDATDLLNHTPLTFTMTSIPTTTSFKIDGSKRISDYRNQFLCRKSFSPRREM
jgi:hypothetical protein